MPISCAKAHLNASQPGPRASKAQDSPNNPRAGAMHLPVSNVAEMSISMV
jgi:hypothetical protein